MGIHDGHREKMRQRFMTGGLDAFADHEILELLLYYAIPRRDTNPIAHALMERYGSLPAVLAAPMEDLKRTEGIGESAAVLLHLVPQVCRRARLAQVGEDQVLNSSERAGAYLLECFDGESREVIYQLCLDRKGKLLACKRLGEGSVASADLDVRRLVENAILTGRQRRDSGPQPSQRGGAALRWGLHRHHAGAGRPSMPSALSWRIISLVAGWRLCLHGGQRLFELTDRGRSEKRGKEGDCAGF